MKIGILTRMTDSDVTPFRFCYDYVVKQSILPNPRYQVKWIIINDSYTGIKFSLPDFVDARIQEIPLEHVSPRGSQNVKRNLRMGLDALYQCDAIAFMNTDCWYNPYYLGAMLKYIQDGRDICGEARGVHYNLSASTFFREPTDKWCLLSQTIIRNTLVPEFLAEIDEAPNDVTDRQLARAIWGRVNALKSNKALAALTSKYALTFDSYGAEESKPDPQLKMLDYLIGSDSLKYKELINAYKITNNLVERAKAEAPGR